MAGDVTKQREDRGPAKPKVRASVPEPEGRYVCDSCGQSLVLTSAEEVRRHAHGYTIRRIP